MCIVVKRLHDNSFRRSLTTDINKLKYFRRFGHWGSIFRYDILSLDHDISPLTRNIIIYR